jgi:hypothetical protein
LHSGDTEFKSLLGHWPTGLRFSTVLQENAGKVPLLCYDCFLPYPTVAISFNIIIGKGKLK